MKILLLISFLTAITLTTYAEELTFRGIPFGSSVYSVIAQEGDQTYKGQTELKGIRVNSISYGSMKVAGLQVSHCVFFFDKDWKLNGGKYSFGDDFNYRDKEEDENELGFDVKMYKTLTDKLSALYGKPVKNEAASYSSLPYYPFEEEYQTSWQINRDEIILELYIKNHYSSVTLTYLSEELIEILYVDEESNSGL